MFTRARGIQSFVEVVAACAATANFAAAAAPDSSANAAHAANAASAPEVVPVKAEQRKVSTTPEVAERAPSGRTTFDIDPIADSAMIAVSLGFAGTLELINSTGEIRPQQISPTFNRSNLFWIDRSTAKRTPNEHAGAYSTVGLVTAVAFAFADPVLSGVREQSVQTGLADAFIYAESLSFTLGLTNIVKMAVRRPRPIAYIDRAAHQDDPNYANNSTDSALSFFSGHAAITASVGATATYLAFARAPGSARPWLTLGIGTALTTFVSVERVLAGAHFPTDVIAGSIAGAGIGLIVPHLHRTEDIKQRRLWIGFTPLDTRQSARGGLLNVSGVF